MSQEVCVLTGKTGAREYSMLEKYASVGCIIAFMDTNKELGRSIKEELERLYGIQVLTELTEEEAKGGSGEGPDAGPAGPSFSQVLRANFPKKKWKKVLKKTLTILYF